MKRKIFEKMLKWKEDSAGKTALLIDGARRVGKSYIAEEFAKENYKSHILIDFNRTGDEVKDLFCNSLNDLDSFFMYLSAIFGVTLYEQESLIILDEVQLFPRVVIPSEERHIRMYPMDFEEFLWAMNEQPLIDVIRLSFDKKKAMGQALHRKAMTLFRQYVIVGGMPQAVNTYIETRSFEKTDEIKRDILSLYREDIAKHAKGYERKVESVFDEIPEQLSKHEKKFTLSSLGRGAKYRSYESSFLWLEDSMICNICYNSTAPNVGIKLNRDRNTLKLYMGDTGLLISHAFDENGLVKEEIYKKLLLGKLEVNEGMVFENVVAQMLTASGHKLYFYSNSSRENKDERMEIDFLIAKKDPTNRHNVSPIEVKSGKRYTYSSLGKFMNRFNAQLDVPYILHTADYAEKDGIVFIPVYWAWLL